MNELTTVELLWIEKRIENRIRFGRPAEEKVLDRRRRVLSFAPGSTFAFIRWTANDYGTVISRIDIVRAVRHGEPCSTVPWVNPGGDILLRLSGWPEGRESLAADRCRRSAWHRSCRRRARLLAPCSQSTLCQRNAARIHALTPPGVAASAKG